MSNAEISSIQNKLRYNGTAGNAQFVETTNGNFLVIYEDDISNLGSKMNINSSILNNSYNSSRNVDNMQSKVENILNTSYPNENALRQAWHNSGAWDMNSANKLANDLRKGIIKDIKANPDLVNRIKKYDYLSLSEKEKLWTDINYIVGGQNRKHSGNTIVGFLDSDDFIAAGKGGFGGAHNGNNASGHIFRYNTKNMDNFDSTLGIVVHENTHGFQEAGRTAINEQAWQYRIYNYNRDGLTPSGYTNQLAEMESRYLQESVSKGFLSELLNSL